MVGIKDFFDAFKGGMTPGQTKAGNWRYLEKYGRVTGTGVAEGDVELPKGKALLSTEEIRDVQELEIELTGPDGQPVALKRLERSEDHTDMGAHNLFRMAEADVRLAGLHHLRVAGPDPEQALLILVGEELSGKDALLGRL